ncbi:hypothetical protein NXW44_07845 [Phocaeicola vulgatus]|uniref:hypothetical protein n=1 Tax=Phocaeicola vulgatus TaxID=821 RepID=UPI0021668F30|nr:hypothetical protein [Phocaeicola vulgatus]MCS2314138.1 hypothetical protein [Phocaeicola vulgatus]
MKYKRYIYSLFAVLFVSAILTSCTEEEGTNPGNDSVPSIIIYQYAASRPNNPDNDIVVRFAANNKTSEAYYLVEKTTEKEAHVSSMGEEGYKDYVVSNGVKIDGISGASNADVTITDLYGAYTITAVAVSGNVKSASETSFTGLEWNDVASGIYYFGASTNLINALGLTSTPTVLQVCTTDADLYRFKDVFGTGYSLKINLIDYKGSDESGKYQFFRIPVAETSFTYGNYGAVGVRDVGYWQGNDAWITDYGYESGMYADYSCFLYIQYFVSAGNIGYGYDQFVAE